LTAASKHLPGASIGLRLHHEPAGPATPLPIVGGVDSRPSSPAVTYHNTLIYRR